MSRFDVSPIPTEQIEEFTEYLRGIRPPLFCGWVREEFRSTAEFIEELYEQYEHVVWQRDRNRLWFHQALGEVNRREGGDWRPQNIEEER